MAGHGAVLAALLFEMSVKIQFPRKSSLTRTTKTVGHWSDHASSIPCRERANVATDLQNSLRS